jgi:hypothetical protein
LDYTEDDSHIRRVFEEGNLAGKYLESSESRLERGNDRDPNLVTDASKCINVSSFAVLMVDVGVVQLGSLPSYSSSSFCRRIVGHSNRFRVYRGREAEICQYASSRRRNKNIGLHSGIKRDCFRP